jgi:ribosomal protein S18 acetylase RimI-like enzyme
MSEPVLAVPSLEDRAAIAELYRAVAAIAGGLARAADEITDDYVSNFVERSLSNGVIIVARDRDSGAIVAEIHGYRPGPRVFGHVIGELTIAVHPDSQGTGIGRRIFEEFIRRVREDVPEVLRVELIARESNVRAIEFYRKLGFRIEGRLEGRIRSAGGGYEADIPMAWTR